MEDDERRVLFLEQVRRVLEPLSSDLTNRQRILLANDLQRLYEKGREITDYEILGCHEMITEHIAPRGQEELIAIIRGSLDAHKN